MLWTQYRVPLALFLPMLQLGRAGMGLELSLTPSTENIQLKVNRMFMAVIPRVDKMEGLGMIVDSVEPINVRQTILRTSTGGIKVILICQPGMQNLSDVRESPGMLLMSGLLVPNLLLMSKFNFKILQRIYISYLYFPTYLTSLQAEDLRKDKNLVPVDMGQVHTKSQTYLSGGPCIISIIAYMLQRRSRLTVLLL